MQDISKIPLGNYCYTLKGVQNGKLDIDVCPYYGKDPTKNAQENGYCTFCGLKDWEDNTMLWDMVKECGINYDD